MEQSHREGCCWLWRDRSRGCEGEDCGAKCLWRKARQPWKQGNTTKSHIVGGAITIGSLSPQASIGSWKIERLAHQMPDELIYRAVTHPRCSFKWLTRRSGVGPQPGGPLLCLMYWTTEKDPRQGSPLSAWRDITVEKDCQRGLLITSYKRLEKRFS